MVDINRSVKNYYEQAQLSDEQLQKLTALQDAMDASPSRRKSASSVWLSSIAASVVVALVLVFFFNIEDVSERVAREVAMNHNKALAVEYQVDNFEQLSQHMEKLDFELLAPDRIREQGFSLVGGRYCSIQGQLAAQIKLRDVAGRIYTLYQTPLGVGLEGVREQRVQLNQVDISLWDEQGLLFALAETAD